MFAEKKNRIVVPYKLSAEIKADEFKLKAIKDSIAEFKKKSCIRWIPVEKTADPKQHAVNFIKDDGCYSELGRVDYGTVGPNN